MLVSVIILNYNTPNLVRECVDSLRAHLSLPHEVIVVDNGSTKKLEPPPQGVRYFNLTENHGFGAGNNYGAQQAAGDYLWLLNSDTLLVDSSIASLFSYLEEHPEVGAATPLLYNDRDLTRLQPDFYARFQSFRSLILRQSSPRLNLSPELVPVDVAVAAALVVRRELFERIGGFDERIFMYMEDDDLCQRLHEAGAVVGVHTRSRIVHLQGRSTSDRERKRHYYRSQDYYWRKHHGPAAALLMRGLRWCYRRLRRPN